jgi:septum formation protein
MKNFDIILGSSSPRRKELIQIIFKNVEVIKPNVEETYDSTIPEKIAIELSKKKSDFFKGINNKVILTADTIVVLNGKIYNKPNDEVEAINMLRDLSSKKHEVITGVTIKYNEKSLSFFEKSEVYFKKIPEEIIKYYVQNHNPFDKAGSYGIQDFSAVFVEKIVGDYYNIMGLPISKTYEVLNNNF